MRRLNEFRKFDLPAFMSGKSLVFKGAREHFAYVNGERVDKPDGVRVEVAIVKDETKYSRSEDDACNYLESFGVVISEASLEKVKSLFSVGKPVKLIHYVDAVVSGTYAERLTVTLRLIEDIKEVA